MRVKGVIKQWVVIGNSVKVVDRGEGCDKDRAC